MKLGNRKKRAFYAAWGGEVKVVYAESGDEAIAIKVVESNGVVTDYPLGPGQNLIVPDGSYVLAGQPLTDAHPIPTKFWKSSLAWVLKMESMLVPALPCRRYRLSW